jgi:hypothetical protein
MGNIKERILTTENLEKYITRLEKEYLKLESRVFWEDNEYEGDCSFDIDEHAKESLEKIKMECMYYVH